MTTKILVRTNTYYDSGTLMALSSQLLQLEGVNEAVVSMATETNKELLANIGMLTPEAQQAGEGDMLIALNTQNEAQIEEMLMLIDEKLSAKKSKAGRGQQIPRTLAAAKEEVPQANIAIISLPGKHATREVKKALEQGLHVMLFSDNVSNEDEKEMKLMGRDKGLLVMGPDCGAAIINQVGLCFANKVKQGPIGLVGASGTGLQEITVQIDHLGYGISQAIGTGGRDLHEQIGGIMMLEGLKALAEDDATEVIVIVSKPPAASVEDKILELVQKSTKPTVVCFIDGNPEKVKAAGAVFASSLFEAALAAVKLVDSEASALGVRPADPDWLAAETAAKLPEQTDLRALYCGGTLAAEALMLLRPHLEGLVSNVAKKEHEKLTNIITSTGHTIIDLGDDDFTVGKPHPMIEPSLRNSRILQEVADPKTSVLLLDFELGFGSHDDPVGVTLETIVQAQQEAKHEGRHVSVVSYLCGTKQDKQGYETQKKMLEEAGFVVAASNAEAVQWAVELLNQKKGV